MKKTFIIFLFISYSLCQEPAPIKSGIAPFKNEYSGKFDVINYDLEIGLSEKSEQIAGIANITIILNKNIKQIPLDFTGLNIQSVLINNSIAKYNYKKGKIFIDSKNFKANQTLTVRIEYNGKPDDGLIIGKNVHGNPSVFADNWPNRARFWFPSKDHPSDKATVSFTIHAPYKWKVIANGALIEKPKVSAENAIGLKESRLTWRWKSSVPIPTYNMVIGAAEMDITTLGVANFAYSPSSLRSDGSIEVSNWTFPEDTEKSQLSFERSVEMVNFFTTKIGPYPYEKLANVQSSTRFGGMENASAIFYSQEAIAKGRNIESTVSHEIAHQWFGDSVTEKEWHHLWLSEGFATYFGALFFEQSDGRDNFIERMEKSKNRIFQSKVTDRPIVDYEVRDLFKLLNSNNYPKGAWVLHMLRGLLGDEIFFRGISKYYNRYKNRTALTKDFMKIMEEVSGKNLQYFFDQWIFSPGYPIIEFEQTWIPKNDGNGKMIITINQTQKKKWPTFIFESELCWDDNKCIPVKIDQKTQWFEITSSVKPDSIYIDPKNWILVDIQN
tara:strand:+ start:801 stop:2462 length:1662 start_codon:yes stop_codon:yes gene_type:complete